MTCEKSKSTSCLVKFKTVLEASLMVFSRGVHWYDPNQTAPDFMVRFGS